MHNAKSFKQKKYIKSAKKLNNLEFEKFNVHIDHGSFLKDFLTRSGL
jgi:hypothetical protein